MRSGGKGARRRSGRRRGNMDTCAVANQRQFFAGSGEVATDDRITHQRQLHGSRSGAIIEAQFNAGTANQIKRLVSIEQAAHGSSDVTSARTKTATASFHGQ